MITVNKRWFWIVFCAMSVIPISGGTTKGTAEEALPARIRDSLQVYEEVKTLSVSWNQYRLTDTSRGLEYAHTVTWQAAKMHEIREDGGRTKDNPKAERNEFAFDGHILEVGRPDGSSVSSPVLFISPAADFESESEYFGTHDFERSGIRFPHGSGELLTSKHLFSQIMFLLSHSGLLETIKNSEIDGHPTTQIDILVVNPEWPLRQKADFVKLEATLRSAGSMTDQDIKDRVAANKRYMEAMPRELKYKFYLDPEHRYAVRRFQECDKAGQLRVQTDCTDHKKIEDYDLWLPANCLTKFYVRADGGNVSATPVMTLVQNISAVSTKPVPDTLFTLRSKYNVPGTLIVDNRLPENRKNRSSLTYKLPAKPSDLDRVIQEARRSMSGATGKRGTSNMVRNVLLLFNIIVPALLAIYFWIRYRHRLNKSES